MSEHTARTEEGEPTAGNLRAKLARGDTLAGTVQPILRHLLGQENAALFGDEILARIRGMAAHLAQQLLAGQSAAPGEVLVTALLDHSGLLRHLHALALEWQLAMRLEQRFALDPVVPPLLQALLASPDAASKSAGTRLLAAQAAWCQAQRRMQLPLAELPGERLQAALTITDELGFDIAPVATRLRGDYDEGASRLGLLARLASTGADLAGATLDLQQAGQGLFLSVLAAAARQDRDAAVLCLHEGQAARLALMMRAAGLGFKGVEQQFWALDLPLPLPAELAAIGSDEAAAMLSGAAGPHA